MGRLAMIALVWGVALATALTSALGDHRVSVALASALIVGSVGRWSRGFRLQTIGAAVVGGAFAALLVHAAIHVLGVAYPRLLGFVYGPAPRAIALGLVATFALIDRRRAIRLPSA